MMKKAIIITVSKFDDLGLATIQNVARTEFLLSAVLANENFGDFESVVSLSSLSLGELKSKLEGELASIAPKTLVYFHIVTHGVRSKDGDVLLAMRDTTITKSPDNSIKQALSASFLASVIVNQAARDIAITLDCCLSNDFRDQLISEVERLECRSPSTKLRNKRLHFLTQETDQSEPNYSDQRGSQFSNRICEWLVTGEAASSNPLVEYSSFAEFSESVKDTPKILYKSANSKFSFVFGRNANRGLMVEPIHFRHLLAEDDGLIASGIQALTEQAKFAVTSRLATIKRYLAFFEEVLPKNASDKNKQGLLELARSINGRGNEGLKPSSCVLIYFTRSWRSALLVERRLDQLGRHVTPFDLNFSSDYNYRGDNLFEKIELAEELIIIADKEWAHDISSQFYELATFLIRSQLNLKRTVILEDISEDEVDGVRSLRDFEVSKLSDFCAGMSLQESDEALGRSIFNDCLLSNQRKLDERSGDQNRNSNREFFLDDAVMVKSAPTRVPNFLVYKSDGTPNSKFILAIADSSTKIDPERLGPDHLPKVPRNLADPAELVAMGLTPGKIGPVFPEANERIERIVIDGNIFFQFLLFPLTPVRVPNVHEGIDHPIEITISSLIRSIQQFYGENKLLFSGIARAKKFRDPILLQLLETHPVFTRFAPTPSSSLHLGNIRTALVSFLFVLASQGRSRFHIRFDDTNPDHSENDSEREDILDDLGWLGIPTDAVYSQTSENAHRVYQLAADILDSAKLVRPKPGFTGVHELDVSAIDHSFAYWLDLHKGAQFIHKVPKRFEHRDPNRLNFSDEVDYSLNWPDSSFKYKFAGVLDDACLNTLVVRDGRQENSLFTARQSIILGALRKLISKPTNDDMRAKARELRSLAKDRIQLSNLASSRKSIRPFPFGAPPIYLHVPRVCDQDGKVLSKRKENDEFSIKQIRNNGRLLPETVLAWALSTMGSRVLAAVGAKGTHHLEELIARFGVDGIYAMFSERVSFSDILAGQQVGDIKIRDLRRSDARILSCLNFVRFRELCHTYWDQLGGRIDAYLDEDSICYMFENRRYFFGSTELFQFMRKLKLQSLASRSSKVQREIATFLEQKEPKAEDHQKMRKKLMGTKVGPPTPILAEAAMRILRLNGGSL